MISIFLAETSTFTRDSFAPYIIPAFKSMETAVWLFKTTHFKSQDTLLVYSNKTRPLTERLHEVSFAKHSNKILSNSSYYSIIFNVQNLIYASIILFFNVTEKQQKNLRWPFLYNIFVLTTAS